MNFEVEYNPKNNKENISKKYGKNVKIEMEILEKCFVHIKI